MGAQVCCRLGMIHNVPCFFLSRKHFLSPRALNRFLGICQALKVKTSYLCLVLHVWNAEVSCFCMYGPLNATCMAQLGEVCLEHVFGPAYSWSTNLQVEGSQSTGPMIGCFCLRCSWLSHACKLDLSQIPPKLKLSLAFGLNLPHPRHNWKQ